MRIPVYFIASPAAVNDSALISMLGLDDGRTPRAAKVAAYKFRRLNNIKTLPGGVYSVRAVERALESQASDVQLRRFRK